MDLKIFTKFMICPVWIWMLLIDASKDKLHPSLSEQTFLVLYFPQFYPLAENRITGGLEESYFVTEWTNFGSTLPPVSRNNHKILKPYEKYDLRVYRTRAFQAREARRVGVDAFLYYHYWLENRAVMDTALQMMLLDGQPDLPFAFCFANEAWGTTLYGMNRSKELRQLYEMPFNHAVWLAPFFKHKNYLFQDGHPVMYVYLMTQMPEQYVRELNAALKTLGIPSLYIIGHAKPAWGNYVPTKYQNASAEFPPHTPGSHRYNESLAWKYRKDPRLALGEGFPLARGILTAWDPTPRCVLRVEETIFLLLN